MLEDGLIERGVRRLGAEQELFLVEPCGNPAPVAEQVLARNRDPHLVPELTRFNLEINLEPVLLEGDGLRRLERQLLERLAHVRKLTCDLGDDIALCGILPTIHLSDLTLDNMTPRPRYARLNEAITRLRGGPLQLQITGIDELFVQLDSIMVEGCNASFQVHLQVDPDAFPRSYNAAQLAAAPVLAAGVNAPVLFGKRLWHETRIAVFRQAIDTRGGNLYLREMSTRALWHGLGTGVGAGNLPRGPGPLPGIAHAGVASGRCLEGAGTGRHAPAGGAAAFQRNGLSLESRLLWGVGGPSAPAHRKPRASFRPHARRRGGQCGLLGGARAGAGPP
ncbi:glutamate-cysteine ligase family protein [Rhodothermus marinus]|uniref:glutamate-cysteine ligase family protein n=1 Tax=Rhodothermus marinus TaxID=29549 RepID=UPI000B33CFD1|nr:glutamate-cysteine ligase family protein [Rhodothermus marinus]